LDNSDIASKTNINVSGKIPTPKQLWDYSDKTFIYKYIILIYTMKNNNISEIDQFMGKVIVQGTGHAVIIPQRNIKYSGLKKGDIIKVWFRKMQEVEEDELDKNNGSRICKEVETESKRE